jgi:hypothetical protein
MREWRGRKSANDTLVAALQWEAALLRDENAQLRLERQQNVTAAVSPARLATLVDAISSGAAPGEVEWATLSEALMLRECLLLVCGELERTVGAIRRQMDTATPSPELDRRQIDRRRATSDAPVDCISGADDAVATSPPRR